jgi:hypothetical protein
MRILLAAAALGLALAAPAPPKDALRVHRFDVELDGRAPLEQVLVYELRPTNDDPSTRFTVWRRAGSGWTRTQATTVWKIRGKGLLGAWVRDVDGDGRVELAWLDDETKRNGQTVHVYRQPRSRPVFRFVQILGSTTTSWADGAVSLAGDGTSTVWRVERPGGRWICSSGCPTP